MARLETPFIPENITVHLGAPNDPSAPNVTLPFPQYIKNVASSEIYPTWPETAIRANIYAIISFALNRIYTEWYRNQGYDFDITNSTAYDQAFYPQRDIFENISQIVDEVFNTYVRKEGRIEPFLTSFCNGTTTTCEGLSQWGTVTLAEDGKLPYQILQHYYGEDIEIVRDAPTAENIPSYPGAPLRVGDIGNDVATIETQLNRISTNYPAIPKIDVDGVFGPLTEEAVKTFQKIFNLTQDGIVGKATWYKINYIYTGIKELGELTSEGLSFEDLLRPFAKTLAIGSYGVEVKALQYYLNLIGNYYPEVTPTEIDGFFGPLTATSVSEFQALMGLEPNGVVDIDTVRAIDKAYRNIIKNMPPETAESYPDLYPGYALTIGLSNDKVTQLQTYLNGISKRFDFVPSVPISNVYDSATDKAVRAIQERYNIPVTGTTGPITWYQIVRLYKEATGQIV